jgi:hypothetical protein
MPPVSRDELETLERKLAKRGFRRIDGYLHECTACSEQAVLQFGMIGRTGGRDIALCQACGSATSWRSGAGLETRQQDLAFDLGAFLG